MSACVCVCVCLCAYTEQCERMDPGHSRVVTHLNEQYWPARWLHACVREKGGVKEWCIVGLTIYLFLSLLTPFLMIVSPRPFVYCVIALTCVYLKTTILCWIIASVVIHNVLLCCCCFSLSHYQTRCSRWVWHHSLESVPRCDTCQEKLEG